MNKIDTKTFPVGWGTFDKSLRKPDGFVHIFVVDDYTSYCLWDHLLCDGVERIGLRPQVNGWLEHNPKHSELPEGNWAPLNIMHTMGTDALYGKAGITKPDFEQLPAVYAVKHGEPEGCYVFNAEIDKAVEFIKEQLAS